MKLCEIQIDCTTPSQPTGPAVLETAVHFAVTQFSHILRQIVFSSSPAGSCHCIIPSQDNVLCSKFTCDSCLEMYLGRQEEAPGYGLGGKCRVFKALTTPWTPSLLPQTVLLVHFLKTQSSLGDALHVPGTVPGAGEVEGKEGLLGYPQSSRGERRPTDKRDSAVSTLILENRAWPGLAWVDFKLPWCALARVPGFPPRPLSHPAILPNSPGILLGPLCLPSCSS